MARAKHYCFFLLFFWASLVESNEAVSEEIKNIPQNEKESLEFFFKRAISVESFGFVLFGDKPMALTMFTRTECLSEYEKKTNPFLIFAYVNNEHGKFRKGYEAWKKYQHLFPSKNYVFIEYHIPVHQETTYIMLLNKSAFLATVQQHLPDFKQTLGEHITPQAVLEEMQHTKDPFKTLKHNNLLLGILFGYGRHNALFFQKKYAFLKKFPQKKQECPYKLQMFNVSKLPLNSMMLELPHFAADFDNLETQLLQRKYFYQRRLILNRYKSADFLETTLSQWTRVDQRDFTCH